jgi:peptidoglycan/LPS O-acetylase OafA/YrhL
MPAHRPARLDALTGLRFWFAFLVVMHHSLGHWFGPQARVVADFGYIGVDFFFVLSGFVLTWSARPDLGPLRFWQNRFARIWPLHLTTLGLAVLVGVAVGVGDGTALVTNLLLVQAWWPQQHVYFGFNAVSWSLSCEVFFYLCFPLLFRVISRLTPARRVQVVVAVTAALLVYPGLFSLTVAPRDPAGWEWTTYVLPLWRLGEFVVGIVAALAVRDGWRPRLCGRVALSGRIAVAGTVVVAAAYVGVGQWRGGLPNRPLTETVGMLLIAMLLIALAADEVDGRRGWLSSRVMVRLGAASYALYLCHALLYGWLVARWSATGEGVMRFVGWTGYVGAAVTLALLLHHVVEVPAERALRHGADHRRATGRRRSAEVEAYPAAAAEQPVVVAS